MDIWNRRKFLQISCQHKKTKEILNLRFSLLDTDIGDRWIALIDKNNARSNTLRYNYRKILNDEEIQEKFVEFEENITSINNAYDIQLPNIVSVNHLRNNAGVLNDLHEQYEVYGDRLANFISDGYFNEPKASEHYNPLWPGDTHNKELHERFLLLNEQIHNFEAIYRTWDRRERSICTCLVDFMPNKPPEEVLPEDYLHEPLKPEDHFLFDPEHKWGWLYLGYNTLGKHWSSSCHDNDVEVVRRGQVRPQARFAAEMYTPHYCRVSFYKWWMANNFSEIIDPRMRLEDLALGFIPVANLQSYSTDQITYTPASSITNTNKWNLEVWSKFNSIIDVKVMNYE